MASITYDEAAHLLRRMGFGGPADEINALVALGCEGAVDQLINYDRIDNSEMENALPALYRVFKRLAWQVCRLGLVWTGGSTAGIEHVRIAEVDLCQ